MKKILEAIHTPAHQEKNGQRQGRECAHTMDRCGAEGTSGLSLLRPTQTTSQAYQGKGARGKIMLSNSIKVTHSLWGL